MMPVLKKLFLLFCVLLPFQASANEKDDQEKPHWRRETLGGIQINHVLAGNKTNFGYVWPLFPDSDSPLFQKTHLKAGFMNTLSPVVNSLGAYIEAHPIRLLVWRLSLEGVGIIPLTGSMDSTNDPNIDFHMAARTEPTRDQARYGTYGMEAASDLTLQMALGGVALRNTTSVRYHLMKLRGNEQFFYYPMVDLMAENNGFSLQNHMELIWVGFEKWFVGVRWSRVNMVYSADEGRADGYGQSEQLGPFVAFELPKSWSGKSQWLMLIQTQWWLHHPNKMGLDAPQWFPAMAVGFATLR
ncbi:MAG: hypothetical protein CMH56_01470 [Myxococcales bacterium]|nr:hypothetical protein [Myxococcales bacterium]|tara:strand:- start:982 stop:1878 length:897 start_codon:yes stop_codon:yes gene_type:complete